ncbi:aspartic proteinase CDR1 [Quercus suber]|uniref:aspartic proteinase CDR1 n=1 Tax=Quercus suber TaxID=58331 RepID=UPI0032E0409E
MNKTISVQVAFRINKAQISDTVTNPEIFSPIEALNGGFTVDFIHRDSPNSPFYNASETHSQRVAKALRCSINRLNRFKPTSSVPPNSLQTDLISDSGGYLLNYSVGTPPVPKLAIVDSGSDSGYSASLALMEYGDESFSKGDIAVETITLGSTTGHSVTLPKTIIGCGHDNNDTGESKASTGIVGLGGGKAFLVSQLHSSIGGKFSYSLVPSIYSLDNASSKLSFGSHALVSGFGTVSTPLEYKRSDTFYNLTLEAMSVGSKRLELSGTSGSGGSKGNIIIDSGSTLISFPTEFYSKFESVVAEEINFERIDDPSHQLSLCYNNSDDMYFPIIAAHFSVADGKLNPAFTFVPVTYGIVCLAFAASEPSIFGYLAQSNLLVGYDLVEKTISFKPTDCTKL